MCSNPVYIIHIAFWRVSAGWGWNHRKIQFIPVPPVEYVFVVHHRTPVRMYRSCSTDSPRRQFMRSDIMPGYFTTPVSFRR